jgi:hypothetical protein
MGTSRLSYSSVWNRAVANGVGCPKHIPAGRRRIARADGSRNHCVGSVTSDYNQAFAQYQKLHSSSGPDRNQLKELASEIEAYEAQHIHAVYRVFQLFFRRRRMARFASEFSINKDTRILDFGGHPLVPSVKALCLARELDAGNLPIGFDFADSEA